MAAKTHSIFDPAIIVPAIGESFKKLNPVTMLKNPVMFVTEVGAVVTTVLMFTGTQGAPFGFLADCSLALVHGPLRQFCRGHGRGPGKSAGQLLRKARTQTFANRIKGESIEKVASEQLRKEDLVVVKAGEVIPGTARSSRVPRPWMNPPSPANPPRRAGGWRRPQRRDWRHACSLTSSRFAITSNPGKLFSIG